MPVSRTNQQGTIRDEAAGVFPAQGVPSWRVSILEMPMEPPLQQPLQLPQVESTPEVTELHEPLYRVLLHNDEITPFDYVMSILGKVFMLSEELAEHVAVTAHSEGISVVIIRHRSEAQRLSEVANRSARADGFPLTFTCEPDT